MGRWIVLFFSLLTNDLGREPATNMVLRLVSITLSATNYYVPTYHIRELV